MITRMAAIGLVVTLMAGCGSEQPGNEAEHRKDAGTTTAAPKANGGAEIALAGDVNRQIRQAPVTCGRSGKSDSFHVTQPNGEESFSLGITVDNGKVDATLHVDGLTYGNEDPSGIVAEPGKGGSIDVTMTPLEGAKRTITVKGTFSC